MAKLYGFNMKRLDNRLSNRYSLPTGDTLVIQQRRKWHVQVNSNRYVGPYKSEAKARSIASALRQVGHKKARAKLLNPW